MMWEFYNVAIVLDDKHSSVPQLDVSVIYKLVIFYYVMHLVNTMT